MKFNSISETLAVYRDGAASHCTEVPYAEIAHDFLIWRGYPYHYRRSDHVGVATPLLELSP